MSQTKVDYYGLSTTYDALSPLTDTPTTTNSVNEPKKADGSFAGFQVFGIVKAPKNEFALTKALAITTGHEIALGLVNTVDSEAFALLEFDIETVAGSLPKITVNGAQVQTGAATRNHFDIPAFTLAYEAAAQILFSAFTLTGDGCHLQSAKYHCKVTLAPARKDGIVLGFDVVEGRIDCDIEVLQVGTATPTLAAGSDWVITAVLNSDNPDSDNPKWTGKLSHALTKTLASS